MTKHDFLTHEACKFPSISDSAHPIHAPVHEAMREFVKQHGGKYFLQCNACAPVIMCCFWDFVARLSAGHCRFRSRSFSYHIDAGCFEKGSDGECGPKSAEAIAAMAKPLVASLLEEHDIEDWREADWKESYKDYLLT